MYVCVTDLLHIQMHELITSSCNFCIPLSHLCHNGHSVFFNECTCALILTIALA